MSEKRFALSMLAMTVTLAAVGLMGLKGCIDKQNAETAKWRHEHCSYKMVINVGGCDRWGVCAVQYADKQFGTAKMPIAGQYGEHCK